MIVLHYKIFKKITFLNSFNNMKKIIIQIITIKRNKSNKKMTIELNTMKFIFVYIKQILF